MKSVAAQVSGASQIQQEVWYEECQEQANRKPVSLHPESPAPTGQSGRSLIRDLSLLDSTSPVSAGEKASIIVPSSGQDKSVQADTPEAKEPETVRSSPPESNKPIKVDASARPEVAAASQSESELAANAEADLHVAHKLPNNSTRLERLPSLESLDVTGIVETDQSPPKVPVEYETPDENRSQSSGSRGAVAEPESNGERKVYYLSKSGEVEIHERPKKVQSLLTLIEESDDQHDLDRQDSSHLTETEKAEAGPEPLEDLGVQEQQEIADPPQEPVDPPQEPVDPPQEPINPSQNDGQDDLTRGELSSTTETEKAEIVPDDQQAEGDNKDKTSFNCCAMGQWPRKILRKWLCVVLSEPWFISQTFTCVIGLKNKLNSGQYKCLLFVEQ